SARSARTTPGPITCSSWEMRSRAEISTEPQARTELFSRRWCYKAPTTRINEAAGFRPLPWINMQRLSAPGSVCKRQTTRSCFRFFPTLRCRTSASFDLSFGSPDGTTSSNDRPPRPGGRGSCILPAERVRLHADGTRRLVHASRGVRDDAAADVRRSRSSAWKPNRVTYEDAYAGADRTCADDHSYTDIHRVLADGHPNTDTHGHANADSHARRDNQHYLACGPLGVAVERHIGTDPSEIGREISPESL